MQSVIDRRQLLALAGCGVAAAVALDGPAEAQAQPGRLPPPNVHGEWVNLANNGVCGVFQAGSVLMMVNENGDMATAQIQGNRLVVVQGWNVRNLAGQIAGNAQIIQFNNGSQWRKA